MFVSSSGFVLRFWDILHQYITLEQNPASTYIHIYCSHREETEALEIELKRSMHLWTEGSLDKFATNIFSNQAWFFGSKWTDWTNQTTACCNRCNVPWYLIYSDTQTGKCYCFLPQTQNKTSALWMIPLLPQMRYELCPAASLSWEVNKPRISFSSFSCLETSAHHRLMLINFFSKCILMFLLDYTKSLCHFFVTHSVCNGLKTIW